MEETGVNSAARRNRREVLGLLLGATFLSPAAFAQKSQKKNDAVILIDEKGAIVAGQSLRLSIGRKEKLYIINEGPAKVFRFENSPFKEGNKSCVEAPTGRTGPLNLRDDAQQGSHAYCFDSKCPDKCPQRAESGGDITIDP